FGRCHVVLLRQEQRNPARVNKIGNCAQDRLQVEPEEIHKRAQGGIFIQLPHAESSRLGRNRCVAFFDQFGFGLIRQWMPPRRIEKEQEKYDADHSPRNKKDSERPSKSKKK